MKEIYENYLENAFGEYEQAEFKFDQFELNYRKFFPENKERRVLDIGVGRGEMLTCMKRWGYGAYSGIDISPSTIGYCATLDLNCELVTDTAEWLRSRRGSFEVITLLDVLEHVKKEATIGFLRAIHDGLAEGGKVIIQVPNLQAPDGHLHRYNDITHEVGYVEHSLQQVLRTAGFTTIEFFGYEDYKPTGLYLKLIRLVRALYWAKIHFTRRLTCNMNPLILHPVLCAVARK